ncbi:MAG TPA: hypothetical protein VF647_19980 [Longimicrobium sp.]|jgi:hypothetical protein
MENYRTQTRQLAYIRREGLPDTFFSAGQEDVEAQQAQHEMLADLAKEGMGETVVAISTVLGQDRQQTEPLLITHDGIVVNGNRRLAGMREMHLENPEAYAAFATIDVMVLPSDVTQKELKEVEFKLQMQRETRLPYEWQDRALAVRDLFNQGVSKREIQSLMRLEREAEVGAMLDQLQEAETYLEEYLEKPKQYELVQDHDQLFGDLQAALARKQGAEKEVARRIGHVMAKNRASFGSRVYDYKAAFGNKCMQVVERLARRRGIEFDTTSTNGSEEEDIFGATGDGDPYAPVRDLLRNPDESASLATDIKEIYDSMRVEERDTEIGRKAERSVQRANTLLNEVNLEQADPGTFAAIRSQLNAVVARAEELLTDVGRLETRMGSVE